MDASTLELTSQSDTPVTPVTFEDVLTHVRERALVNTDKGDDFERMTLWFLRQSPVYQEMFADVWQWKHWEAPAGYTGDKKDKGIDLVAKNADNDKYTAIQCKFYDSQSIDAGKIDRFLVASDHNEFFDMRLVVTASKGVTDNVHNDIKHASIPVQTLTAEDLRAAPIDWGVYLRASNPFTIDALRPPSKQLRDYQETCIENCLTGFRSGEDRGQVRMACGTGKTFVGLKLAEQLLPTGGTVLCLMPSLALVSQMLRDWIADCDHTHFRFVPFVVCSDTSMEGELNKSKHAGLDDETEDDELAASFSDISIRVTTKGRVLSARYWTLNERTQKSRRADLFADQSSDRAKADKRPPLEVVFSTYHSLVNCITDAQQNHHFPDFDLVICDEAHRTAGKRKSDADSSPESLESPFHAVHFQSHLRARHRLYMTATPRFATSEIRTKASEQNALLYSMDDIKLFGRVYYTISFSKAVELKLLAPYRIVILKIDPGLTMRFQANIDQLNHERTKEITDETQRRKAMISTDEAALHAGLYRAFLHQGEKYGQRQRRSITYTNSIRESKRFASLFRKIAQITNDLDISPTGQSYTVKSEHIDGKMPTMKRDAAIARLRANNSDDHIHILSNVRCLTEGIDIPALDSIVFLQPRKSIVDVIQAVGRVMRRAEGKQEGFIVLPIIAASDEEVDAAYATDERFRVVRQVIEAIRAHDELLSIDIDLANLNDAIPLLVDLTEIGLDGPVDTTLDKENTTGELYAAIEKLNAAIVKKSERPYWPRWTDKVKRIVEQVTERIEQEIAQAKTTAPDPTPADDPAAMPSHQEVHAGYQTLVDTLRAIINPELEETEIISTLAQDMVTAPLFNVFMGGEQFTKNNAVAKEIDAFNTLLRRRMLHADTAELNSFIDDVKRFASGLKSNAARRGAINEMYGNFFSEAFPKLKERLGIVYTPDIVVNYLLASAQHVLRTEFGKTFGDVGVHVYDPFAGTGTFTQNLITNYLSPEEATRKFHRELHSNEILLFAHYMGTSLIELAYVERTQNPYTAFTGSLWTDSFQIFEDKFKDSSEFGAMQSPLQQRRLAQVDKPITVIVGNPPYSAKQKNSADNNQNTKYFELDHRISATYAAGTDSTNKNTLYDSYLRAIRMATDQLGDDGVIAFVTNGSFIDGKTMDGLRACLRNEFAAIYCFNTRGDARTAGEPRRKEGGNVFGQGTRTSIAMLILVKNSKHTSPAIIRYHDIGDYLTAAEKLNTIKTLAHIGNTPWEIVEPDFNHDWIDKRESDYTSLLAPMGDPANKDKQTPHQTHAALFHWFGSGLKTGRDMYAYDFSHATLQPRLEAMAQFFNTEVDRYRALNTVKPPAQVIKDNTKVFTWDRESYKYAIRGEHVAITPHSIRKCLFRPFVSKHVVFLHAFNQMQYRNKRFFPKQDSINRLIGVSGIGNSKEPHCFMVSGLPDLNCVTTSVFYAEYWYDADGNRHDNISDSTLEQIRVGTGLHALTKPDIFDYIYGVLHAADFREKYAANLRKERCRIPIVADPELFAEFQQAGAVLGLLHTEYESVDPHPAVKIERDLVDPGLIKKIKHAGHAKSLDRSKIVVSPGVRLVGIPDEAYAYVVNGKPAVQWVMEGYSVIHDKQRSGITHDPNTIRFPEPANTAPAQPSQNTHDLLGTKPEKPAKKYTGELAVAGAIIGGVAALFTVNPTLGRLIGYAFVGGLAGSAMAGHEKGGDKPPELTYTPLAKPPLEGADYVADLLSRVIHVSTESDKIIKSLPNALNTTLITLK